jgi:hypothetical protein
MLLTLAVLDGLQVDFQPDCVNIVSSSARMIDSSSILFKVSWD